MKHSRRWAAWLAAILIAASLVVLPREGVASGPFIFGDPPVVDEGEPDGPPPNQAYAGRQGISWSLRVLFVGGRLFILVGPTRHLPLRLQLPSRSPATRQR